MLTGELPYGTPSPADLDRLIKGELHTAPRLKNPRIPKSINDIVLKALAPQTTARYQRAADLLNDILAAGEPAPRRGVRRFSASAATAEEHVADIQSRLKAREDAPTSRFCWHCRKPLHARSDKCPFCGEQQ
jgi:serine/threonine protein kinase